VGNRLLIRGKVDYKFKGSDQIGFIIEAIEYLQDLKKRIKALTLRINVRDLDEEIIESIYGFADETQNTGIFLNFMVYDPAEKIWVELEAKTMKLNISNEFFEYIDELRADEKEIDYKFN